MAEYCEAQRKKGLQYICLLLAAAMAFLFSDALAQTPPVNHRPSLPALAAIPVNDGVALQWSAGGQDAPVDILRWSDGEQPQVIARGVRSGAYLDKTALVNRFYYYAAEQGQKWRTSGNRYSVGYPATLRLPAHTARA